MSVVYKAHDTHRGAVSIKILPPDKVAIPAANSALSEIVELYTR
jgi:hypothetical protein